MDYQAVAEIINRNFGLYTIITDKGSEKKRLFLSAQGNVCEFVPRSRKRGYAIPLNIVENWRSIEKVQRNEADTVAKFRRYAARASFPSAFVRKCLAADPARDCYENRLTTGTELTERLSPLKPSNDMHRTLSANSARLSWSGGNTIRADSTFVDMTEAYG